MIERSDGLSRDEGHVMDALVDAANAFATLKRQHPQELAEFLAAIHHCQALLALRLARRTHPEGWPTYNAKDEDEKNHGFLG